MTTNNRSPVFIRCFTLQRVVIQNNEIIRKISQSDKYYCIEKCGSNKILKGDINSSNNSMVLYKYIPDELISQFITSNKTGRRS